MKRNILIAAHGFLERRERGEESEMSVLRAIWHRSQNAATLVLVALAAFVFTLIVWGWK